jgi:phosphoribosylanthranilate isomerase
MGFNFYPSSKRWVGESFDARLIRNIPSFIGRVGVFVNESLENIIRLVDRYGLDYVQLHGNEDPSLAAALKSRRTGVIKAFGIDRDFDFRETVSFIPFCEYFLFDNRSTSMGGSGEKFDWRVLENYTFNKFFFLAGGIAFEDTASLKSLTHPALYGLDINSCFEIQPGIKDVYKVNEFIKTFKKI